MLLFNFFNRNQKGFIPIVFLFILVIFLFFDIIFSEKNLVISHPNGDLTSEFLNSRQFGFSELREGNLPLWNPHIFSGVPFFESMQPALLYPLNWIYLFFPLHQAINVGIVLHIFLSGVFMHFWLVYRGYSRMAGVLSGTLFMFCGAHFMHTMAGHLSNLCTMIWAPLLFLSADGWLKTRNLIWCCVGMGTVTMQILAGHPQYLFYNGIAFSVYSLLKIFKEKAKGRAFLGLVSFYFGGILLGAVQFYPALAGADETLRGEGVSYNFAAIFSFPPENFITLLIPKFFGDMISNHYWGRHLLWEMSLYLSISGLVLFFIGAFPLKDGEQWIPLITIFILLLLCLGGYTPLLKYLHAWVPGFDKFRGNSKFILPASVFLIFLAGMGFDRLKKLEQQRSIIPYLLCIVSILLFIFGTKVNSWSHHGVEGILGQWIQNIQSTGETYLPINIANSPEFVRKAGQYAAQQTLASSFICFCLTVLIFLNSLDSRFRYFIFLLTILEIGAYAHSNRVSFNFDSIKENPIFDKIENYGSGSNLFDADRIYISDRFLNNQAMAKGLHSIWGSDPRLLKRYAEFMYQTQENLQGLKNPEPNLWAFTFYHRLYKMLRLRHVFVKMEGKWKQYIVQGNLPRLNLVQKWEVIKDRNAILNAMEKPDFNPFEKVILETLPDPQPGASEISGTVRVLDSDTDYLSIEAKLSDPSILLITDSFSSGWRVFNLSNKNLQNYRIYPANYTLKAIPLKRGEHHIRIEYLPGSFVIGRAVTLTSLIIYLGILFLLIKKPILRRSGEKNMGSQVYEND